MKHINVKTILKALTKAPSSRAICSFINVLSPWAGFSFTKATRDLALTLFAVSTLTLQSCSTDVGGNEDKTKPVTTVDAVIDADSTDGEIVGTATLQWTTVEPNKSTVDIFLSSDSGATFPSVIALNAPDIGSYVLDTNTVADCRTCRLRIIATDIVGNVGAAAESAADFIINNVPQVFGTALFYENPMGRVGIYCDDTVIVPFDKDIEVRSPDRRDVQLQVIGDEFGDESLVSLGPGSNELTITMADLTCDNGVPASALHLHLGGSFSQSRTHITSPSGLDISDTVPLGVIVARDTGRTAEPSGGIDIAPTLGADISAGVTADTVAVAMGDLDDNGTQDLVIINIDNVQSIYSNDGLPTPVFAGIGTQMLGDAGNTSVAVGDVDGNGSLDIVVGNTAANRIYTNDGSANFSLVQSPGSSATQAVALGDIDGNGSLDLVTGNAGQANRVWRNNGSGVFSEDMTPQVLGTNDTRAIALGDIDGDGDLDMVTGNSTGQGNRVYINDGVNSGNFTDSTQSLGSSNTFSVALGDVDGDGDLDLTVGNAAQANRIWINDGSGVFNDSGQLLSNRNTLSVALADIDRDGDLDLVSGNLNQPNRIWFNNAAGVFTDSGQTVGIIATRAIAVGDIDGDGDPDLLVGNGNGAQEDRVWRNSQRSRGQVVYIDSGQSLGSNDTRALAAGDIDGDGDNDLVVGNFNQANRVWVNDTGGLFSDSGQLLGSNSTSAVALGDVDNDGDLDMVTGNDIGQGNGVWLNNGNGVFTDSGQSLGSSDTSSVSLGDIDDDGDLDLVTGNVGQDNRVWRNNGSGVFSEDVVPQTLGGTNLTTSIILGDVDNDGDLDLVTGNVGTNQVWLNSGVNTGVFVADQVLSASNTQSVVLGDIDGDGNLDLVEGNNVALDNRVWFNDGSLSNMFTGPVALADGNETLSVALGDVDGDADLDLVTGNDNQENALWLNNSGVFTNTGQVLGTDTEDTRSLIFIDVDNDGDLDVITANAGVDTNRVWSNDF